MDEEQQQKAERKKPGCKSLKNAIFLMAKSRQNCEVDCRRRMPSCLIPLTSCCLVQVRTVLYIYMIDPFMIFVAFWTGIISCIARCFGCPCGKDLVFSSMECFTAIEELIGIYWDSDWWREYEKKNDDDGDEESEHEFEENDEEQGISHTPQSASDLSHRTPSHQSEHLSHDLTSEHTETTNSEQNSSLTESAESSRDS